MEESSAKGGLAKGGLAKGGLFEEPARSRWSLGGGFAPLVGVDARFSGLGNFSNPLAALPLGGGQNYVYDNGFVGVDSSGNAGGLTWNWGYDNNAQYSVAGDSLDYSISNSLANASVEENGGLNGGFEVFGLYEMGEIPSLQLRGRPSRWGLKATFHYANISIDNGSTLTSDVTRVNDSFALNGVLPPLAPYSGSFGGPGPLLGDAPSRSVSTIADGAIVTGSRDLDVDLFSLSVGPYLEFPITDRFSVSTELGLSLAIASGDYDFRTSTTIAGAGTQTSSGSGSETSFLGGVSLGANAIYQFTEKWSAYGGVKYQYFGDFEIDAGDSTAELDFGSAFQFGLGAIYRF